VIENPESRAHSHSVNWAVTCVKKCCLKTKIKGYTTGSSTRGGLSYLVLSEERSTEKVQLTLIFNARSEEDVGVEAILALVSALEESSKANKDKNSCKWHSIYIHCNPADKHDNSIIGRTGSWRLAFPREPTFDAGFGTQESLKIPEFGRACDLEWASEGNSSEVQTKAKLFFPPQCFRQANLDQFTEIVKTVRRHVAPGSVVVELYGGVGTIGIHLSDVVASLDCSDENPFNESCFNRSKNTLPPSFRKKLSYTTMSAAAMANLGRVSAPGVNVVNTLFCFD
jgi:23S rRNA (uracil1939-C5)-methyltransferase